MHTLNIYTITNKNGYTTQKTVTEIPEQLNQHHNPTTTTPSPEPRRLRTRTSNVIVHALLPDDD